MTDAANLPGMTPGEWLRKATHMAAFGPALLLPWLTPAQALFLALFLLLFNLFAMPRLLPGLYRPQAPGRGALEVVLYPAALLAVVAAYGFEGPGGSAAAGGPPWYLPPMAAWFCIAFLDAGIGLGCRLLRGGPTLAWNPRKPLGGFLLGTAAAVLLAALALRLLAAAGLIPDPADPAGDASATARAAVLLGLVALCALAESAWFGIADNLTVPFAFCALLPLLPTPLLAGGGIPDVTWPLLLVPAAFGVAANLLGLLTLAGALLGTLMALLLMAADPQLFAFLGGFFLVANLATRFRFAGKAARKVAEARGGKRAAAQVFGAMGASAWMTPLVHLNPSRESLLVCAAPFLAKTMDTVSSEMGKALGGRTISLRTFRAVPPGTEGAVSLGGTLWGLAAAAALGLLVPLLGWGGAREVAALVLIALLANVFESYWGEWAARRGLDDGPQTNFLMTLAAALLAWAWFL